MSTTTDLSPAPTRTEWLRSALIKLAALEAGYALLQTSRLFATDVALAKTHLGVQITTAHLIAAPIFAIAAFVFARRNQLPLAIIALAAVVLTTWASELMSSEFTGIALILANVVRPIVAVAAIILAACRTRLGVAAFLAAGAWLLWFWATFLFEVLLFTAGALIYGV